jgi:type IV pilus assembly protein PilV
MTNPTAQSGFTLLEVMIALVIFSIGLLGLSGLQAISLQNNQVAYSRTVATMLAYDMADRIRANNPAPPAIPANYATAPLISHDCVNSTCTSAQMAEQDRFEWNAAVADPNNNLLNAVGSIALAGTTYTITIGWDENRTGATISCGSAGIACVSIAVTP